MILFIRKLFFVLLIGLIPFGALDILISSELKKSNSFALGDSFIWNEIYKGKINYDLLIYGSSRAWVHFNSMVLEENLGLSTYNLGMDGHNFWLQYLRHKALLKYNMKPKVIILSVGIFSLNKRNDLYNLNQFLPFIFDLDIYKYTSTYEGFSLMDYTIPLYRYSGKQDVIKKAIYDYQQTDTERPYRIRGFRGMKRAWNQDLEKAKSRLNHINVKNDKASEDLMQQFLNECNDLGIKVIIVYSPEQVSGQSFVENRDEVVNTYVKMAKRNGITFLDYSDDEMCYNKSLFYNSMHLNEKGANIFTNKLIVDLKKLDLKIN